MRTWIRQKDSPAGAKVYHSGRWIKSIYSKTIFYRYIPKGRNMWPCNWKIIKVVKLDSITTL